MRTHAIPAVRSRWRRLGVAGSAALVALGSGCRADDDGPGAAFAIIVVSGANQTAPVGSVLPTAPSVRVRDGSGNGVQGITVRFTVTGGGGTVLGDSAITDVQGNATVTEWILGTATGANALQASATGIAAPATITATAVAGSPAAMVAIGAQNFAGLISQRVSPAPGVEVDDAYGNKVPGTAVTFTVSLNNGSVTGATLTTDALGRAQLGSWTLGATPGYNRVTASTSNGTSFVFEAYGLSSAPTLSAASPIAQAGYLNFPVTIVPRVLVTDALGNPIPFVPVTFAITSGGDATLSGPAGLTDSTGVASPADWRLGPAVASSVVTATVPGFGNSSVTFSATGVPAVFRIDLRFLTSLTAGQRDAFVAAARRWMKIITAAIPTTEVTLPAGACANGESPAIAESIDGVVIYAEVNYIDGPNGILGASGPCVQRSGSFLTAVGAMRFDIADFATLETRGQLVAVVTHEMAHVLGYGTSWLALNLTQDWGDTDPIYVGANAMAVWPFLNLGYLGRPVPLENQGPTGTRDVHWRESVFHTELMTGYIENPGVFMPLSKITIAQMKDLGYSVDTTQADPFAGDLTSVPNNFSVPTPLNEVLQRAEWEVTPDRQTRRIRPQ